MRTSWGERGCVQAYPRCKQLLEDSILVVDEDSLPHRVRHGDVASCMIHRDALRPLQKRLPNEPKVQGSGHAHRQVSCVPSLRLTRLQLLFEHCAHTSKTPSTSSVLFPKHLVGKRVPSGVKHTTLEFTLQTMKKLH